MSFFVLFCPFSVLFLLFLTLYDEFMIKDFVFYSNLFANMKKKKEICTVKLMQSSKNSVI